MSKRFLALLLALALLLCACGVPGAEETLPEETVPEETQEDDSFNGVSREQIIAAFQVYPDWVLERDKVKPDYSNIDESVPVNGVYQIHTAEGLEQLAQHPDAKFELLWDIDLENTDWTPVGTADAPFTGSFDGKGYTISNVNILSGTDGNTGFFGVSEGQIKDLELENVTINADGGVAGGIAAVSTGSIEGSSVSGKMTLSGSVTAGGLVGKATAGSITESESFLHMEAPANATVGVLGGELSGVTVTKCRFTGPMNLKGGALFTDFAGKQTEDVVFEKCLCRDNTNSYLFTTEEEQHMRDIVVEKMYAMGTVEWTPATDLIYVSTSASVLHNQDFYSGVYYYGLPYTGKSGDLSRFLYCFDEEGNTKEFINRNTIGSDILDVYMGVDCSAAVYWSWVQVSPTTEWRWTRDMFATCGQGTVMVGDYVGSESEDSMVIFKSNDEQVMAEGYALLRKGDAATTWYTNPDNTSDHQGHTRMLAQDPVIYRNAEGLIDIENSYVITHEQGEGLYSDKNSSWVVYGKYNLREMFSNYYFPISCQELREGKAPACQVTIDNDGTGKAYMTTGVVESNYRLISTAIRFYDEAGQQVWEKRLFTAVDLYANSGTDYATRETIREFDIAAFAAYIDEAPLEEGKTYTYELSAIPGPGEEYILKTFDFVQ